jgi:hypothetical protein
MYIIQEKTRPTRRTFFTLDSHMVPDHTSLVVHVRNLSLVPTRMKYAPTPKRNLVNQRQTGPVIALDHLFFLPHNSLRVGERGFNQVVTQLHQLTGPITPVCARYVQYLLAGANPLVLNQHRRGLQPWRCRLFIYHSLTFPTDGLHFLPKGLARSQVTHPTISN